MSDTTGAVAAEEGDQVEARASLSIPPGAARMDVDLVRRGRALGLRAVSTAADGSVLERREVELARPVRPAGLAGELAQGLPAWLPLAAFALYLLARLVRLDAFPIYFFTDEAIQTVLAADLVRDGFRSYSGELLPTFLQNGGQYNLSVSVYLQVIPYLLFGKSIWVTRAVSVLVTLLAAWAVWRILRDFFQIRSAWVGILILSALPAWFLHSRTAFETVPATAFYAVFLYFYLKYRCQKPEALYVALVFGALAFYTYSPMQLIMLVTAALLLASDAGYHWRQRRTLLAGLGLALVLAIPYIRFMLNHPAENLRHMQILSSYWTQQLPLVEKLKLFLAGYARGLSPFYWYLPNDVDFVRHQMKGYAHLMTWMFPFMLTGLALALGRIRSAPARVALAALLAAPTGAALVSLGVTRALVMVIPAAIFTGLGAGWWLARLEKAWPHPAAISLGAFALLAGVNGYMLWDAQTHGPTWFHQYDLGGMQYGARQVFPAVEKWMQDHPGDRVIISPIWANGADVVGRFFQDPPKFSMGSVEGYIGERRDLEDSLVFVMTPPELEMTAQSGKFESIRVEQILPYPDGQPGFIFARLRYIDEIDRVMQREKEARQELGQANLVWEEEAVRVRYSTLDMGQIKDAFDDDDRSLLRTLEANPLQIEVTYDQPRPVQQVSARVGGTATRVTVSLYEPGQASPWIFSQTVFEQPEPRYVVFSLPRVVRIEKLKIDVLSVHDKEPAHVHLWEIRAQ